MPTHLLLFSRLPLENGSRLAGYEILAPLGSGGMGEVYRALDSKIGREVALKILPDSLLDNQDRLARFQREAQSAGALNHPNLMTIHELGFDNGRYFIVSELLDGTTLRDRMSGGPLSARRAIEYAAQIAEGLAAAHEQGVVHRDLKPENLFVTREGRVKILDFGLAKVTIPSADGLTDAKTAQQVPGTDPGTVLGTVGYMSPEQVRGESVDGRSDIFALGAILYEMVSGQRAFHGSSSVDTLHAILHADPKELASVSNAVPPALSRIVDHCLEKDAKARFQSARDLAFDLNAVSGSSTELIAPLRTARLPIAALWIVAILVTAFASWFLSRHTFHPGVPRFRRLTFQARPLGTAVFAPDQQSILTSSPGVHGPPDIFVSPIGSPEMRGLGLPGAQVLAVSRRGELAVLLNAHYIGSFITEGTLARVPFGGGAPREVMKDVSWADWTPSGDDLMIMHAAGGKTSIEMPIGTLLYEASGWLSTPRVSPDGQQVAFAAHPHNGSDDGSIVVVDSHRNATVVSPSYASVQGVAWTPDGKQIWYTASPEGSSRALYSTTPKGGTPRLLVNTPGTMTLHDISRGGRVLVSESTNRIRLFVRTPSDAADRELSWLDWSLLRDLSPDGKRILFDESGEGGGKGYAVYVRDTDGSPAVRLGDGVAMTFSHDGTSALVIRNQPEPPQVFSYPIGAGSIRQLTHDGLSHDFASWTPDGGSLLIRASDTKHRSGVYLQSIAEGIPRPVTPPNSGGFPFSSPDGRWVFARDEQSLAILYPLRSGDRPIPLPEMTRADAIAGWSPDAKQLLFVRRSENPARVFRLDLASHRLELRKQIPLPETLYGVNSFRMTSDERTYAYSVVSSASDYYLLDGVK